MQVSIRYGIIENEKNRVLGKTKNKKWGFWGDTYAVIGRPSNLVKLSIHIEILIVDCKH